MHVKLLDLGTNSEVGLGLETVQPQGHCDANTCMWASHQGIVNFESITLGRAGQYRLQYHVGHASDTYDFAVLPLFKFEYDLAAQEIRAGMAIVNGGTGNASLLVTKAVIMSTHIIDAIDYAPATEIVPNLAVRVLLEEVEGVSERQVGGSEGRLFKKTSFSKQKKCIQNC